MAAYTEEEIQHSLRDVPEWERNEGSIERTFTFSEYLDGIQFVNKLGAIAEEKDHHPYIGVDYGKVTVSLTSHDVKGLSARDFDLAQRYDEAYTNLEN